MKGAIGLCLNTHAQDQEDEKNERKTGMKEEESVQFAKE